MESSKKEKDTFSIPILFNDSKDLYIGKGSLKYSKNSFKFLNTKPAQQKQGTSSASSKYSIKEFTIISKDKDKSKKTIAYKGREAPQDSTYILMKYNSDNRSIQMCPANKWINFVQSLNYLEEKIEDKEKKIEDKEDKRKKEIKEQNSILKQFFNFDYIDEMREDLNPKRKTRKKKGLLDNNKDEDLNEDEKKKKKNNYNYDEDSHSSENDPNLDDYSDDNELEKLNEEKEEKKKEEDKDKDKEKDDSDDLFDEDDKSFEKAASEVDESEYDKDFITDLLNNKRKREKYPDDSMKEELDNLIRKKGQMTYEEIYEDLIKKFKPEIVQQYIEQLLDEYTKKYNDGKETYYFLIK